MKYFIALSYQSREQLAPVITAVKKILMSRNDEFIVFTEIQTDDMPKDQVMREALQLLNQCDVFLAEVSKKAVGVGIEMGVAHATGKPIILFREKGSEPSQTMEGIASYDPIEYDSPQDLPSRLIPILDLVKFQREIDELKEENNQKQRIGLMKEIFQVKASEISLTMKQERRLGVLSPNEVTLLRLLLSRELLLKQVYDMKAQEQQWSFLDTLETQLMSEITVLASDHEIPSDRIRRIEAEAVTEIWKQPETNRPHGSKEVM